MVVTSEALARMMQRCICLQSRPHDSA